MKICDEVNLLLSDYIDGRLDLKQKQKVEGHINICPECAEKLECLRKTVKFLAKTNIEEPLPENMDAVLKGIKERFAESKTSNRTFFRPFVLGAASIFVFLAVIIGTVYFSGILEKENNDEYISLTAARIAGSLLKDAGASGRYIDDNIKIISGNKEIGFSGFLEILNSREFREIDSFSVFVGKTPRALAYQERASYDLPYSYVSQRTEKIAKILCEYKLAANEKYYFVSVFFKKEGSFIFVIARKKENWKIQFCIKEV